MVGTPKEQAAWLRAGLSRHSNASDLEIDFLGAQTAVVKDLLPVQTHCCFLH